MLGGVRDLLRESSDLLGPKTAGHFAKRCWLNISARLQQVRPDPWARGPVSS